MKNKMKFCFVTLVLFAFVFPLTALEWKEIDSPVKSISFKSLLTVGEYQFATVEGALQVYRRKGDGPWELVYNNHPRVPQYVEDGGNGLVLVGTKLITHRGMYQYFVSPDMGLTWDTISEEEADLYKTMDYSCEVWGDTIVYHNRADTTYLSFDGGQTRFPLFYKGEEQIKSSLFIKDAIYLCGWGQVYRTSDTGAHWDTLSTGLPERTAIHRMAALDEQRLFVTTDEGVYQSNNHGESWTLIDSQFSATDFSFFQEFVPFDGKVFGMSRGKVYSFAPGDSAFTLVYLGFVGFNTQKALSLFNGKLSVAGPGGVYEYEKEFQCFILKNEGVRLISQIDEVYPSEQYLFLVTKRDCGYVSLIKADLEGALIDTLYHSQSRIEGFQENGKYQRLELPGINYLYSSDSGQTWEQKDSVTNPLLMGVHLDTIGDTLFYGDRSGLRFSLDQGLTWSAYYNDTAGGYLAKVGDRIYTYKYHHIPNTPKGYYGLHYTDNLGESVHAAEAPLDTMKNLYYAPTAITSGESTFIVGGRWGAYCANHLDPWRLDSCPVNSLISMEDSLIFGYRKAKTSQFSTSRVHDFYSADCGKSWFELPSPAGETELGVHKTGAYMSKNSKALYCTQSGILYTIPMEEVTGGVSVIDNGKSAIGNPSLVVALIKPNAVTLQLQINRRESYEVSVFNVMGKELQKITGVAHSETEQLAIDRRSFAAGYYLARVVVGSRMETIPLLLK